MQQLQQMQRQMSELAPKLQQMQEMVNRFVAAQRYPFSFCWFKVPLQSTQPRKKRVPSL